MNTNKRWLIIICSILTLVLIGLMIWGFSITQLIRENTRNIFAPLEAANAKIQTEIALVMNPTPTIIPDPITIVHAVRALARLETIQYSIEKIITAEVGQGEFDFLFGDRLLFVAHGFVIAGIDMQNLAENDIWFEGETVYVRLPSPEVFVATLDNEKSYVYDREKGILTKGDPNLETRARQVAEDEILSAALEDGILNQANENAEVFLDRFLSGLGFGDVVFLQAEDGN